MKILIISNLYPPVVIGGYELGCRDVVDSLRSKGHQLKVITSTYLRHQAPEDENILRLLRFQNDGGFRWPWQARASAERDRRIIQKQIKLDPPDIVYFWNLSGLHHEIVSLVSDLGIPAAVYVSDHWLSNPSTYSLTYSGFERRLDRVFLRFFSRTLFRRLYDQFANFKGNIQCTSGYIRDQLPEHLRRSASVIHWGVTTSAADCRIQPSELTPVRIAFAGRVGSHKGIETLCEAFQIAKERLDTPVELNVYGAGENHYVNDLLQRLGRRQFLNGIIFHGQIDRADLPKALARNDVFVLASEWQEPFSIVVLEALAAGCAVIAAATGGTPELIENEEDGLLIPPKDPITMSDAIERLVRDTELRCKLSRKGQEKICQKFTLNHMVSRIESALTDLHTSPDKSAPTIR